MKLSMKDRIENLLYSGAFILATPVMVAGLGVMVFIPMINMVALPIGGMLLIGGNLVAWRTIFKLGNV